MNILFSIFLFIIGSLTGSFFYTLALRYMDGSIKQAPFKALFSRSHCPECNTTLHPLYLVPIVSYFALGRRCAYCKKLIPIAYPLFEVLFGFIAIVCARVLKFTPGSFELFNAVYMFNIYLLTAVSIIIVIVDIKTMTIPNSLVLLFIIFSLFPVAISPPYIDHLYGSLLMLVVFGIVMFIFPGGFGGGDLKFAPAIGLFLGLQYSIIALEIALISGALVGVIYGIISKRGLRIKIPFAPFLSFGMLVAALLGDAIMLYYYKIFY